MTYTGLYINLDRSTDRRAQIDAQLAQHGLDKAYRRFPGADGNTLNFPSPVLKSGEMGCFTSHYLLLKENLASSMPLHVIEDDVIFSRFAGDIVRSIATDGCLNHYDLVYTDIYLPTANSIYRKYKMAYDLIVQRDAEGRVSQADFQIIDLRDGEFAATASFVVSPNSIVKLHDLYEQELRLGARKPLDLFIRDKTREGVIKAGCLFPFVTSIRLDDILATTIEGRDPNIARLASAIARQSFFIECDMQLCQNYIKRYLTLPGDDGHLQLLAHILGFSLTKDFRFL